MALAFVGTSGCNKSNIKKYTTYSSNDIAVLSIYTFDGSGEGVFALPNLGHSFLTITSLNSSFKICNYQLIENETICIGTWSILEHFGVWYNLESNYINFNNKYNGRISLSKGIDLKDIDTISSYIDKNDEWTPFKNCSCFAIGLWNSVAKPSENLDTYLIYTPSKLVKDLKSFTSYDINKTIKTQGEFGYYKNYEYVSFEIKSEASYV